MLSVFILAIRNILCHVENLKALIDHFDQNSYAFTIPQHYFHFGGFSSKTRQFIYTFTNTSIFLKTVLSYIFIAIIETLFPGRSNDAHNGNNFA